jgi:hypothetical protein
MFKVLTWVTSPVGVFAFAARWVNLMRCFAFSFSSRLPGGGVTFFAAAKKVTKESSFF